MLGDGGGDGSDWSGDEVGDGDGVGARGGDDGETAEMWYVVGGGCVRWADGGWRVMM